MKMVEKANEVNDKLAIVIFKMYERWQHEKAYEDFNEYVEAMKKHDSTVQSGTKRPFGFKFQCDDGMLHVVVKASAKTLSLEFRIV